MIKSKGYEPNIGMYSRKILDTQGWEEEVLCVQKALYQAQSNVGMGFMQIGGFRH